VFCLKTSNRPVPQAERSKYEDEYNLMKNFDHPNIPKCESCFWNEDQFCIVVELIDGGSLLNKVQEKLNELQIIEILVQILEGLNYLHSKKVFHRDLKPNNLLLTRNGQIKIGGFGVFNKY
jgi:serine/threonine protein kinase